LNDETVKQLDELSSKYPRLKDKTMLISWLIADAYDVMQNDKQLDADLKRLANEVIDIKL
jgi:hypothetical protein